MRRPRNPVARRAGGMGVCGVMEPDVWNEQAARSYDESSAHMYTPDVLGPAVDFLERRAGRGRTLEFAVGTGRVALPLRARGVRVAGIEAPFTASSRSHVSVWQKPPHGPGPL